ncbi:MAG TPA: metallophosphoesterase [Burkholderiales bacterium]|nr:metallophosphoesterase [Burkholderiales bacterium]
MLRILALVVLLHLYMGWRLLPDLPFGAGGIVATVLLLVLSAGVMPFGGMARRKKHSPLSDHLSGAGFVAMGFFSSLLVLTLLRDGVLLAGFAASGWLIDMASLQELRGWSAAAVPILAVFITFVGFINARRRAAVRNVDIPIAGLPARLHGFSIAQISDVHVGATIKHGYVSKIVDAVNALDADMIAVTGDLVDGSVIRLSSHTAPLGRLSARHGAFFVTGNHEYYSGANAWVAELRRLGLCVLLNEHIVLEHDGEAIVVAGVTDYSAHHFDPAHRSDPAAAIAGAPPRAGVKVLLAHQPQSAFAAAKAGFDLQLSGHTHGGQFFPWNLVVKLLQPFAAGLHRLDNLWVYVSRGTGYWGPPKRFGAPSEITHIRLVPASAWAEAG